MVAHCHKVVAGIAKEICAELYEKLMGDNEFYDAWKKQNPGASSRVLLLRFVAKNWGNCLQSARKALTMMLNDPHVPDSTKEEVMDILIKDRSLIRGRADYVGRASTKS